MRTIMHFACIVTLWFPLVANAAIVVDADQLRHGAITITDDMQAFHDRSGQMTLEQVSSPEFARHFESVSGPFNGGLTKGAWWLRVDFEGVADLREPLWLHLHAPLVEVVELWFPQSRGDDGLDLQYRRLGTLAPASARDVVARGFVVSLEGLSESPATLWIRLSGSRPLLLNGSLWLERPLMESLVWDAGQYMGLLGASALLMLVALAIGTAQRDIYFFALGLHLALGVLLRLSTDGLFNLFVFAEAPEIVVRIRSMGAGLGLFTGTLLAYVVLEVAQGFPRVAWLLRLIMLLGLALMIPAVLGRDGVVVPVAYAALLGSNILFLCLALLRVYRRVPLAIWPLIAYGAGGGAAILMALRIFQLMDIGPVATLLVSYAPVVFALSIAIGLGLRIRHVEQSAHAAQQRALEASREAGARLEATVAERTSELHQALAEQRNFLSMVSHEFRSPLSNIAASAQLLAQSSAQASMQDPQAARETGKIRRAAQRMVGLMDTLLSDEWLDSARMSARPVRVDLRRAVADMCADHQEVNGTQVRFVSPSASVFASADPMLLRIVINNLLDNAIKYAPGGRPVEVSAEVQGGDAIVTVRDHGPGIPVHEQPLVFDRYYRATGSGGRAGLGLGLYMVKRILELHQGTVTAGDAEGGGTIFTLRWPSDQESFGNKMVSAGNNE